MTYQLKVNEMFFDVNRPSEENEEKTTKNDFFKEIKERSKSTQKNSVSPRERKNSIDEFDQGVKSRIIESEFITSNITESLNVKKTNGFTSIVGSQNFLSSNQKNPPMKANTFDCFKRVNSFNLAQDFSLPKSCTNLKREIKISNTDLLKQLYLKKSFETILSTSFVENRGSSQNDIAKEICAFCEIKFTLNDFVAKTNSCGHIFHKHCFDSWIEKLEYLYNLKCPVCKTFL